MSAKLLYSVLLYCVVPILKVSLLPFSLASGELPAMAKGVSRDQRQPAPVLGAGSVAEQLPWRTGRPGPHWKQGAHLQNRYAIIDAFHSDHIW